MKGRSEESQNTSGIRQRLVWIGRKLKSGEREKPEIQQSKSNSSFCSRKGSGLQKNTSFDKMLERLGKKGRNACSPKAVYHIVSPPRVKNNTKDEDSSTKEISMMSGLLQSKIERKTEATPVSLNKGGWGQMISQKAKTTDCHSEDQITTQSKRESLLSECRKYDIAINFKKCPGMNDKYFSASKKHKISIGKNMSDLLGALGTSNRYANSSQTGSELKNPGLPNRSTHNILNSHSSNFLSRMDPGSDLHSKLCWMVENKGFYNDNRQIIRQTGKPQLMKYSNQNISSGGKEISKPDSKIGGIFGKLNAKFNREKQQKSLLKKTEDGSNTYSTFQTNSMLSFDIANFQRKGSQTKSEVKTSEFEIDGETLNIVNPNYPDPDQTRPVIVPDDSSSSFVSKILRGFTPPDRNEQKFFLPKASAITIIGFANIDTNHTKINFAQDQIKDINEYTGRISKHSYEGSESIELETPTFSHPLELESSGGKGTGSVEFTFGRTSVDEMDRRLYHDSPSSNYTHELERENMGSYDRNVEAKVSSLPQTQRILKSGVAVNYHSFRESNHMMISSNYPVNFIDNSTSNIKKIMAPPIKMMPSNDKKYLDVHDQLDSNEDSERYNLYRNVQVSDSEDNDGGSSGRLSRSPRSTRKVKLYDTKEEENSFEEGQLFVDDELRTKYLALMQKK